MTPEELAVELRELYNSLGPLPKGDPEAQIEDISFSNEWLARSAVLEAEAGEILDRKRGEVCESYLGLPPTMAKIKIDADSAHERRLYALADRLNATLTHRIESLRSLLSYEKQGLAQSQKGGYTP